MKFSENSEQAVNFLRQAVPTMMQHNIVPNPLNYTLWYSYYSHAYPELNSELDRIISEHTTCPPELSEALFIKHISQLEGDQGEQLHSLQDAFAKLVGTVSESFLQSADHTSRFSEAVKHSLDELGSQTDHNKVSPVLSKLSQQADEMQSANAQFQAELGAAQTEIDNLREELTATRREALTDPLTGLQNRRALDAIYAKYSIHSTNNKHFALVIMDIDKFKAFNDKHGHLLGDQILQFIGKFLQAECEEPTVPVRFGGEEFAIVCPTYALSEAQALAEKLRKKLSGIPFNNKRTGDTIAPVTASFGVCEQKQDENLMGIIERADSALYAAKNAGRNKVEVSE